MRGRDGQFHRAARGVAEQRRGDLIAGEGVGAVGIGLRPEAGEGKGARRGAVAEVVGAEFTQLDTETGDVIAEDFTGGGAERVGIVGLDEWGGALGHVLTHTHDRVLGAGKLANQRCRQAQIARIEGERGGVPGEVFQTGESGAEIECRGGVEQVCPIERERAAAAAPRQNGGGLCGVAGRIALIAAARHVRFAVAAEEGILDARADVHASGPLPQLAVVGRGLEKVVHAGGCVSVAGGVGVETNQSRADRVDAIAGNPVPGEGLAGVLVVGAEARGGGIVDQDGLSVGGAQI